MVRLNSTHKAFVMLIDFVTDNPVEVIQIVACDMRTVNGTVTIDTEDDDSVSVNDGPRLDTWVDWSMSSPFMGPNVLASVRYPASHIRYLSDRCCMINNSLTSSRPFRRSVAVKKSSRPRTAPVRVASSI